MFVNLSLGTGGVEDVRRKVKNLICTAKQMFG